MKRWLKNGFKKKEGVVVVGAIKGGKQMLDDMFLSQVRSFPPESGSSLWEMVDSNP